MVRTLAAVFVIASMLLGARSIQADPYQSELKAYRCLVADWSETSGGTSHALSPDGMTLVYLEHFPGDTRNDKVWVVLDIDKYNPGERFAETPTGLPKPWQLKVEPPPLSKPYITVWGSSNTPEFRNVDWSPDGKRVAFICNARLYVAEGLELKKKSAKARMVADVGLVPPQSAPPGVDPKEMQFAEPVRGPRWSPDGTRIVFVRPSPPPGVTDQVCVVDVSTGKETVLANNAIGGPSVWQNPWSRDSSRIAYNCSRPATGGGVVRAGVSIVSVKGGAPRRLIDKSNVSDPSWSPKGDRLAYIGPLVDQGFRAMLPTVYISDSDGKNPVPIAPDALSEDQLSAIEKQMYQRLMSVLSTNYPGVFTSAQLKALSPGRVSDSDVIAVLMIAEGIRMAKTIGGEFQKQVEAALKRYPIGGTKSLQKGLGACVDISTVAGKLPKDKYDEFQKRMLQVCSEVTRPLNGAKSTIDMAPVWSPDGTSLAFIRWDILTAKMRLMLADLTTRKAKTLFESDVIESVSWANNGKSLLLAAKRNLAYSGKTESSDNPWPAFVTMPSYPEIWMLDLK